MHMRTDPPKVDLVSAPHFEQCGCERCQLDSAITCIEIPSWNSSNVAPNSRRDANPSVEVSPAGRPTSSQSQAKYATLLAVSIPRKYLSPPVKIFDVINFSTSVALRNCSDFPSVANLELETRIIFALFHNRSSAASSLRSSLARSSGALIGLSVLIGGQRY